MPLDTTAVLRLMELLSANDAIRANVKHSLRNGLVVGSCATAGSVVLGPVGVAAGAAVGTGLVYAFSSNNYVSLMQAVNQLSNRDRDALVTEVNTIIGQLSYEDVLILQTVLASGSALSGLSVAGRAALVTGIRAFFDSNTSYSVSGS